MEKRKRKRFLACVCAIAMVISNIVPTNLTYAETTQQENLATQEQNTVSEEESSEDVEGFECDWQESCVLDEDDLTVFDTWEENRSTTTLTEENAPLEITGSQCSSCFY